MHTSHYLEAFYKSRIMKACYPCADIHPQAYANYHIYGIEFNHALIKLNFNFLTLCTNLCRGNILTNIFINTITNTCINIYLHILMHVCYNSFDIILSIKLTNILYNVLVNV